MNVCKDDMELKKSMLFFPGQGSQFVGMGKDLALKYPLAKERFAEADDILKVNLFKTIAEGPEEVLTRTEFAQPAIFTFSAVLFDLMVSEGKLVLDGSEKLLAAGHSLGEFSAVYAAGGYSFADGLRLVKRRSELMSQACRARAGKMLAVVRIDTEEVEKRVAAFQEKLVDGGALVVANINGPKQVVVSGDERSIDDFAEHLASEGVRAVALKVAGAFHSPLMESVLPEWKETVSKVQFQPLRFPLIANVTGESVVANDKLNDLLYRQLVSPVQWVKTMSFAINFGCENFYEVGPGRVLAGLLVKFQPSFNVQSALDTLNA